VTLAIFVFPVRQVASARSTTSNHKAVPPSKRDFDFSYTSRLRNAKFAQKRFDGDILSAILLDFSTGGTKLCVE
jgi:hypothetical protein